ncbi:MAG: alanine:cation symporter family protein, partial [Prevotella sp.]|nr:alanine:cation symporter family protein [Prevotella sp.]
MSDIFSSDSWLNMIITEVNDFLWTYILIAVLVGCGLWFTWRTRFVQFRMLKEMIRLLGDSSVKHPGHKHISSFQAFAVSVATRVGTGNLAGVATAIAIGGPGAVFWMWIIALIGSATAFVESTLAQLFKLRHKDSFIGGPAYYIQKGMHNRWMSALFAILITITFGLSYNSIQSNTICQAMNEAFGWNQVLTGIVLVMMSLAIVFGGIQRIAKVSSVIVPVMAIGYFILAFVIVLMNIHLMPHVFKVIISNAFGLEQITGGGLGATMMNGIKRGLFSNEAGEGSAPNVAATASVSHPVKQGLIQALGVFTDTLLVCSCTAFIILISGLYAHPELNGIALTQSALQSEIGSSGPIFIAIAIFLFAFSSIIGNYYYGEANIRF